MHNWQPFPTPHGQPNAVPQHQCSECGACRTAPDPDEPEAWQYWWLPPFPGAASSQPSDEQPACHDN